MGRDMPLNGIWKNHWIKVKGWLWERSICERNVKTLYNCIIECHVSASSISSQHDVVWINKQVLFCCQQVENALSSGEYCSALIQDCSFHETVDSYNHCLDILESLQHLTLLVETTTFSKLMLNLELLRVGICLGIVWLAEEVDENEIQCLLNACLQRESSCKRISLELTYLAKRVTSSFSERSKEKEVSCPVQSVLHCDTNEIDFFHQCHPSMLYFHLVSLYKKRELEEALSSCLKYIECDRARCQYFLPLLYNLAACCCVRSNKPLMAIVYWRRAIECCEDEFYLLPLLYNLHRTYRDQDMLQPASDILNAALSLATSKQTSGSGTLKRPREGEPTPRLVLKFCEDELVKFSTETGWREITGALNLACYCARFCLKIGNQSEALTWYKYSLNERTAKFNPKQCTHTNEYHIPIDIPSVIQVTAEYTLALLRRGQLDDAIEVDAGDLSYCSAAFKRAQVKGEVDGSSSADKQLFVLSAFQLHYCIVILLYKISVLMSDDHSAALQEIGNCLRAMDTVRPCSYRQDAADGLDDVERQYSFVRERLSRCKAMLHFNMALLLSFAGKEEEKSLLKTLQSVLHYDNRSIETRWNVALLLWHVGQREESIKTWCKTRSINYKLGFDEIKTIRHEKVTSLDVCESATKRIYLQRDVSILNELLTMIS